ncbi:MAG TPA: hypothetical protein VM600_07500, partial [Actinomycetota bacterium]|nr:hypothetical protein [Actinomycetota bacterium]
VKAPMTQCIQRADGPPESRPAGTGGFHSTHGHWHYEDIIGHQLFRVTDPTTGEMVATGAGKKLGYSPADQGMPEWAKFDQAPPGSSGAAGNCAPGTTSRLGMSRGWGDAYRYQRPGNYVEFGDNTSGYFVVQTIADPRNDVLESDESDNTAYAYISVAIDALGTESIDIIESGIGQSPWDPAKKIIDRWYEYPETVSNWPAES